MAAAAKVPPTVQDRRDTPSEPPSKRDGRRFYTTEPGSFVHIPKREINRLTLLFSAAAALAGLGFVLLEQPFAALACAVAAVFFGLLFRRRGSSREAPTRGRRCLVLQADALSFEDEQGQSQALLRLDEPYGVTLVTPRARDRLVVVLTSRTSVFVVGSSLDPTAQRELAPLLARASALASDEAGLEAIGPDGDPIDLAPRDLVTLVELLVAHDRGCLERMLLSDAKGLQVVLDGSALSFGTSHFELGAAIEWRAFVFQERFGNAVAIYQATWVKQNGAEVVFVSLLPSLMPSREPVSPTGVAELDRATIRDQRLHLAQTDSPPPRATRIAIDRLFMLPLRAALDRAPRPSRTEGARA